MGGTPSKRMLMLIMQLPPGSSKYRICPFITEKTVLSGNYIQVDIDKLCRVRATTQCAFGVSWSNPRAVGLVQKNCIFSPWVLLLTQELNLSHLLSLLRARYITQQVRVRGGWTHSYMNAWMGLSGLVLTISMHLVPRWLIPRGVGRNKKSYRECTFLCFSYND